MHFFDRIGKRTRRVRYDVFVLIWTWGRGCSLRYRRLFFDERSQVDNMRCGCVCDVFYDHGGVFFDDSSEVSFLRWKKGLRWMIWGVGVFVVFYERGRIIFDERSEVRFLRWEVWRGWFEVWRCFWYFLWSFFFEKRSQVDDLRCGGVCDVFYDRESSLFRWKV